MPSVGDDRMDADEEEMLIFPITDVGLAGDGAAKAAGAAATEGEEGEASHANDKPAHVTRAQRRLALLGLCPLTVRIPNSHVTDTNKNWYHALKKVWSKTDPWQSFHIADLPAENAVRHRYNALKQQWTTDDVIVKMEKEPFNRGAMRQCFRLKKLSKFLHSEDWKHTDNYVAKHYMEDVERQVYFDDVQLQMDAKLWGEEYNRHNPPKKVDIFQMYIIEFTEREGKPLYHLEHFIEGEYVKYNSNSGFVDNNVRQTPQAFTHFTFERSGHQLMVVDVQGVGDLYTDPQIHTAAGKEYGNGNLGTKGMALFFHTHICGDICESLGLHHFDLAPSEIKNLDQYVKQMSNSSTRVSGHEEPIVSPSPVEQLDLTRLLLAGRQRSSSSCHSATSGPDEDLHGPTSPLARSISSGLGSYNAGHAFPQGGDRSSEPECSGPESASASVTRAEEEERLQAFGKLFGRSGGAAGCAPMMRRTSCLAEKQLNENQQTLCSHSILGQIHHDLAKYHEIGRFVLADSEIDWSAALFHEEHAALLGIKEAIVTMAKIYLQLPHDVLVECTVLETDENTNRGVDYMVSAAKAGDRAAMIYMANAYESGNGLGTQRTPSYREAVFWLEKAVNTQEKDESGEYDAMMTDPAYQLLAKMAGLYRTGGADLSADPQKAGDLYTSAADAATEAMKGRLANQYYALAEEAWAEVE